MALIPTRQELGPIDAIARRPGYSSPQSFEGAAQARMGAAVQNVGDAISAVAADRARQREAEQRFATTQAIQQLEVGVQEDLAAAERDSPVNGDGLETTALRGFDQRAAQVRQSTPAFLRDRVDRILGTQRVGFEAAANSARTAKRDNWFRTGINETLDGAQNQIFQNPDVFNQQRDNVLATIRTSDLPEAERAELETKIADHLGEAYFRGMMERDPAAAAAGLGITYTAAGAVSLPNDPSLPAGMRNNNPGNIKFVGQGRDRGVLGPSVNTDQGDPQAVFESPEAGMVEMYNLAMRKYDRGQTTVNQIIAGQGGWTPGNTQAAANIARTMGVDPNEDMNLAEPERAAAFMRAVIRQEHGSASDAYSDDMIRSAVSGTVQIGRAVASVSPVLQGHLQVAKAFLGASEGRDADTISYFIEKATGKQLDPRQTAWCAYWLNAVFQSQGVQGTNSGMARSFLNFGTETNDPQRGDVVVFERGNNGVSGHVGIIAGFNDDGSLQVLGANQSNSVSVARYGRDKVLGYRRPPDVSTPEGLARANEQVPGGGSQQGLVIGDVDPRYRGLTFAARMRMVSQAEQAVASQQATFAAQQKADYGLYSDRVEMGILTGSVSSEDAILNDPNLTISDKNKHLRSLRTQMNTTRTRDGDYQALVSGGMVGLNPRDSDAMGRLNGAYNRGMELLQGASEDERQAFTRETVRTTGALPQRVKASIEGGILDATNATALAQNIETALSVEAVSLPAFNQLDAATRDAVSDYRHFTIQRGMTGEAAAARVLEARKPESKQARDLYGAEADKLARDLDVSDVTSFFDEGFFSRAPGAGATVASRTALMTEYQEEFRDAMLTSEGDPARAKAKALNRLSATWGISEVSGSKHLMKLPPERFFPPVDGGFEYLRDDALAAAREWMQLPANGGGDREVSNVFLTADARTVREAAAGGGGRPSYAMVIEMPDADGDGEPEFHLAPYRWGMPETALQERLAPGRAAEAETFRSRDAAVTEERDLRGRALAAGEAAQTETVGPDWMKARAADIAREGVRQGVEAPTETIVLDEVVVPTQRRREPTATREGADSSTTPTQRRRTPRASANETRIP